MNYELGQEGVLIRVENPITRSAITLKPVIEIHSDRALVDFENWIFSYCKAAWEPGRLDPKEIDASNWRDGLPAGV